MVGSIVASPTRIWEAHDARRPSAASGEASGGVGRKLCSAGGVAVLGMATGSASGFV